MGICDNYFLINSLAGGGAERVAINLMNEIEVNKVFLLERDVRYNVSEEKLHFLSRYSLKTNSLLKTFFIPFYARRLLKNIDRNSLVISLLERANYVNILASFFSRHRAAISVHMSQKEGRRPLHPYNFLSKWFYPKANLVVCVSKAIANELERYYGVLGEKIRVIYNPVDLESIRKQSYEPIGDYQVIFESPTLITAGRLTKQKGQWYLLRIFSQLKKDISELKLVILGDGELKEYLVSLCKELGLKPYLCERDTLHENYDVYFLGFQKNPFKFIAKAKLFVFPSLWEGLPCSLIEAMACGVPVFSSDCRSGPREILAPDTDFEYQTSEPEFAHYGILMPVFRTKFKEAKDPLDEVEKIWVDTLRLILNNEKLREKYAEKARFRAEDFDIKKIAEQWIRLLEEVRK